MKLFFKTILGMGLLALTLNACEKKLYFKDEITEPKMVLNGNFQPDSTWKIKLTESLGILESSSSIKSIQNATVFIENSNNQRINLIETRPGVYEAAAFPVAQEQYKITASKQGMETVYASSSIPQKTVILDINTRLEPRPNWDVVNVEITLKDRIEENFYGLLLFQLDTAYLYDMFGNITGYELYPLPLSFTSTDPVFNNNNDFLDGGESYLFERVGFNDDLFNGQEYQLNIFLDPYLFYNGQYGNPLYVILLDKSEELYWYDLTYQKAYYGSGDPFAQPVQVYNNIENGLGIFAGFNYHIDTISRVLD